MQALRKRTLRLLMAVGVLVLFTVFPASAASSKGPHVVEHPESQIIQPGESFTLNVTAEGPGELFYQWVFDGQAIPGATGREWTVPQATADHTGTYGVTVFNAFGFAQSATARITVLVGEELKLTDAFADRPSLVGNSGMVLSDNFGATRELHEPEHGEQKRGSSVWATWVAPADGVVTLSTAGSEFDTVIAVYAEERLIESESDDDDDDDDDDDPPTGNLLNDLESITDDDDDSDLLNTGKVQFLALAGVPYQIAVEGYQGQEGRIVLSWDFFPLDKPFPIILQVPSDRSIREGDSLELSVNYEFSDEVEINWLADGWLIPGGDTSTLVIPNFSVTDVARYQLRFKTEEFSLLTPPVEIQINSEGRAATIARDKLEDAILSSLTAPDAPPNNAVPQSPLVPKNQGLSRGFSGVQIFETLFATKDPLEPDHCGEQGGASYWFVMTINESGTLILDTVGSTFDTVLAVYTAPSASPQFDSLTVMDCNNDIDSSTRASRVSVQLEAGTTCYVVVDGVNGAKGSVRLNYAFTDGPLDLSRLLSLQPQVSDSDIQFQLSAVPGYRYVIEYKDSLRAEGPWITLTNTGNLSKRQLYQFKASSAHVPTRYYRITAHPSEPVSTPQ